MQPQVKHMETIVAASSGPRACLARALQYRWSRVGAQHRFRPSLPGGLNEPAARPRGRWPNRRFVHVKAAMSRRTDHLGER